MSLGGYFSSSALQTAVNNAWNAGVVMCAAAGNDGNSRANYPAYYTNCIAVCATDQNDKRAYFSNYGSWCDVSAPGVGILSTTGGDYATWNGTSMATPHVTATAALVWNSSYGTSAASVRNRIESTKGPTIDAKKYTPGIVNANAATGQ
jgi:thermitase